ncbi:MAG TPA: prepilin-type N-terminal cleavage/methylation domain-containing protein [Rickettsiales bacterium]|nr:prepilin-type N-terminal cleavage/methylation domain-containing protein [Rickettsiales bacterium]
MPVSYPSKPRANSGFTLVEMSIVLVLIGLLIGGVLAGRTLIDSAAVSSQISQINKYQAAVHMFETKFNYLPGDIPDPAATNNGFQSRGSYNGEGDGSGLLEGNCANTATGNGGLQAGCGELAVFWQDLSTAGLIDTNVKTGTNYPNIITPASWPNTTASSTPAIQDWIPKAKVGGDAMYVYVYSGLGHNFYGVSTITKIGWSIDSTLSTPGIAVQQAYNIDTKADDGLPQSGNITACYVNSQTTDGSSGASVYAAGSLGEGKNNGVTWLNGTGSACTPNTAATAYAATNCFDNNGSAGTQQYSVQFNPDRLNCALSFQFQ